VTAPRTNVLLLGLLFVVMGLTIAGTFIGATVSAKCGGRTISAESGNLLSPARVVVKPGGAEVELGSRRATVRADRIELPGNETLLIPTRCKRITLRESGEGISVVLDGVLAR